MNVFMLLVQDMIPPTSDSVPLVAKYYTATTIGMSVGVIIACYNLRLYFIDPTFYKMPNWMKKYVLGTKQLLKLLKLHYCRFENVSMSLCSCKNYTLKISHS